MKNFPIRKVASVEMPNRQQVISCERAIDTATTTAVATAAATNKTNFIIHKKLIFFVFESFRNSCSQLLEKKLSPADSRPSSDQLLCNFSEREM